MNIKNRPKSLNTCASNTTILVKLEKILKNQKMKSVSITTRMHMMALQPGLNLPKLYCKKKFTMLRIVNRV